MTRWLVLSLGLAIAAGAVYLMASGGSWGPEPGGPAQGEIDDESRARLEHVLREADREEAERR